MRRWYFGAKKISRAPGDAQTLVGPDHRQTIAVLRRWIARLDRLRVALKTISNAG